MEKLRQNLEREKRIIVEMDRIIHSGRDHTPEEKVFLSKTLGSLKNQLKMLNKANQELIISLSKNKQLDPEKPHQKELKKVSSFSYTPPKKKDVLILNKEDKKKKKKRQKEERKIMRAKRRKKDKGAKEDKNKKEKVHLILNKEDKKKFLGELAITGHSIGHSQSQRDKLVERDNSVSQLASFSNKVFGNYSAKLSRKLGDLKKDLRESNIKFLLPTYISIAIFVSLSLFVFSLIVVVILSIINLSNLLFIWVPFVVFVFSLFGFYFFPALQKGSLKKDMGAELPFATIYMSAISGSNLEPTKIFKIISGSPEYPLIGREFRKVVNQVEVYGYDLVTALKNVASATPDRNFGELLGGMATNILSGGSLKSYLEKKADSFLADYKLERKRYVSVAETFMDVYISVLITAPLILMMLFVVMGIAGLGVGMPLEVLLVFGILIVVVINILFIVFLQMKQPKI